MSFKTLKTHFIQEHSSLNKDLGNLAGSHLVFT